MQGVPRFAEATVRVVEEKHAGWRTPATGRDWVSSFERYAFPRIGKMPVWEDTSADLLRPSCSSRTRVAVSTRSWASSGTARIRCVRMLGS